MAEKKQPWMKWYPSDWRSEPALRMVSRSARSLWMDMLGLMHEAEPYGELRLNGKALKPAGLAALLGDRVSDVSRWLLELEVAGVSSRTSDGVIFSRRMVRDRAKALKDKENGSRGGNPAVKGEVKTGVNPPDKAQRLDTRDQKPDSNARGLFEVRWSEIWAAFQTWGRLPDTSSEERTKAACLRMASELPSPDDLVAAIHAQGDRLREGAGKRGGWATAPHNWLERDNGWADKRSNVVGQPDEAKTRAAWDGRAGALIDALGEKGHGLFVSYFYDAKFEDGPVPRITVHKPFVKTRIEELYRPALAKAFGCEVILEVAA